MGPPRAAPRAPCTPRRDIGGAGAAACPARPRARRRADEATLARALGLSAFEASQRRRRGGIGPPSHPARGRRRAEEAARLRGRRAGRARDRATTRSARAEPVIATRGAAEAGALALEGDAGPLRLAGDGPCLVIVRGTITREYPVSSGGRGIRVRLATLEPGYRVHLHRRDDARPVELDPAAFEFGPGGAPGGAQLQIAAGSTGSFPRVPRDDSFRLVIPALAPAAPPAGPRAAAAALARPAASGARSLDNVAQFRFHSAWRAAARRRARLTP